MVQDQKNHRKMYGNVLYFLLHAGALLLGIKRVADLVKQLGTDVQAIDAEAQLQQAATTGITRSRNEVKREAADKAEALRGLVLVLSPDEQLKAALKKPVSGYLSGAERAFLTYAQQVVAAMGTLLKEDLKPAETGYDPAILAVLVADLAALNAGTGEVVEMQ